MIQKALPLIATFLLAGQLCAENLVPRAYTFFRFNELEQKHPKANVLALPISGPVVGVDNGPLSFTGTYQPYLNRPADPGKSLGKVILTIEVIRNSQVIWETTKKSKVKDDRNTTNYCGECVHLKFCNKFQGSLQKGDLVLFHFQFKGMPRFNMGDVAAATGEVYVSSPCE